MNILCMESGVEAQINHLFNNGLIERISKKKWKIKGKGRIYNPPKPPSKILTKVVGSLYKKRFRKESKPTRRIINVKEAPEGSAKVLLKFIGAQVDQRRSPDFQLKYGYSQDPDADNNTQIVELRYRVETESLMKNPPKKKQRYMNGL